MAEYAMCVCVYMCVRVWRKVLPVSEDEITELSSALWQRRKERIINWIDEEPAECEENGRTVLAYKTENYKPIKKKKAQVDEANSQTAAQTHTHTHIAREPGGLCLGV